MRGGARACIRVYAQPRVREVHEGRACVRARLYACTCASGVLERRGCARAGARALVGVLEGAVELLHGHVGGRAVRVEDVVLTKRKRRKRERPSGVHA
eukprot:3042905-Pleurochrysis_carterae.AAC.1